MEKERRKKLLEKGIKENYSHLLIIVDRSEIEHDEIIRYVRRDEDIKEVLFRYIINPSLEIWNVFSYDMDLEKQINEKRPYHVVASYDKMNIALDFARDKHSNQTRKDGSPYINHPIMVAEIVKKYFYNHPCFNELVTASYLHDTLEDTDTSIEEIKSTFGEYVSYLVLGVTNDNIDKRRMGKTNYLCNKLLNMDSDVLNLKLCDRLANILDLSCASDEFIEKYEVETTIIVNYLMNNRSLSSTQQEIINVIDNEVNLIRKNQIKKLVKKG